MNWVFSKLLRSKSTNQEIRLGNQNEFSGVISPNKPIAVTNEPVEFTSTVDGVSDSRPYKVYSALIGQVGTSDPNVITLLENTFSGTPVWSRSTQGEFAISLTDAFTVGKTSVITSNVMGNGSYQNLFVSFDESNVPDELTFVNVVDLQDTILRDDGIVTTFVEIRVYN